MRSVNDGDSSVQMESPSISPSMSLLQGSSNFSIHNSNFNQIHGNATIIRFGDSQFTQDQRNWICDYISSHATLPDIHDNLISKFLTQSIINLPRAEAMFNDYQNKKKLGPCFEGTRVALLREIVDWVTDMDRSKMYILSGLAGIGKSTVAYTIASRAAELNLLGASFFFSRDESDRNNAKKLFTTIAYQLCVYDEAFANAIGDALQTEHGSAAITKDPQEQLQILILNPLQNIVQSRTRPILVIVDALDECDENEEYTVIMGLSQLVRDLPPFKVILTTRPKSYRDYFQDGQEGHKLFHLQNIEDKVVDSDIRLYLKHSLSLEQVRKRFLKRTWCASDTEIDCLVHAAGRLFIIASTAVRYILDKTASSPATQMQNLLHAFAEHRTPFKDLDLFYTVILRNVVPVDCDNDGIVDRYQSVIGAIIFVQRPLPVSTLSHLIHMDEEEIHVVLDHLQSVILLDNDDVPRIYHKSFPDYLMDQARCKDARLRIDPMMANTRIATCCFEIANKHLKYNILQLGKMARYMNNKNGLNEDKITDEQLEEKIPQQLRYACVCWADHLQVATIENAGLMDGLSKFVNEHTLHWIEVLSLVGNLDLAHRALRIVLKLLNLRFSDLRQLLSDTLRFIARFYEIIKRSALHTYYSALPFSPTDSLLYRQFIKEAERTIFVIEGWPEKWDGLVASPSHGEALDFIKFSHDNALFFSFSQEFINDGKLKIWDAATGTPISTILTGKKIAVNNDFSTIASLKDDIITCYNMSGSKRGTMPATSSKIRDLALSDSGIIAAALADRTVLLWETKDNALIHIFDDFKDSEYRILLQFSSTGTRLAYSSAIGSVTKLRDGMSGRFIADLQCGSWREFLFSGDGSRIACLSSKRGVTLWSSESGALMGAVRNDAIANLAISANGTLLATADSDKVTLWSENDGHLTQIQELEFRVHALAFSLDNILAIGATEDIKLYNVNTQSISALPFRGFPLALAFSPDCTRFAYGGYNKMYLWDIQRIDTSSPPSNEVTAIALSRDCSRLTCGYKDSRVELWGTNPAMQQIASHKAHKASAMGFKPDGTLFASVSFDRTIKLWNGESGSLHETLESPISLGTVALSNSMLVAAGLDNVTLWSLDTPRLIHAFQKSRKHYDHVSTVSISDESDFAAVGYRGCVDLFDVANRTIIATFKVPDWPHKLTFLPDKSHLVVQSDTGAFISFSIIKKRITKRSVFKLLIQLHNTPLWRGVPIWYCRGKGRDHFAALFSRHKDPVSVLWIPTNLSGVKMAEGSSMIALGCRDGRIVLLRLPTSHKDISVSRHIHCPSRTASNPQNALFSINQHGSRPADRLSSMSRWTVEESDTEQTKDAKHVTAKRRKTAIVPSSDDSSSTNSTMSTDTE